MDAVGVEGIQGADGGGVTEHQGLAVRAAARVRLRVAGVGAAAGGAVNHLHRLVRVVVIPLGAVARFALTPVQPLRRVGPSLSGNQLVSQVIPVGQDPPLRGGGAWGLAVQPGML